MATFKKGDVIKVVAIIPQGPVESIRMDEEGTVQYLISWTGYDGAVHTRWFDEADLTLA
jgi:hypothetical protein